jgi:hypothetical protein
MGIRQFFLTLCVLLVTMLARVSANDLNVAYTTTISADPALSDTQTNRINAAIEKPVNVASTKRV